jgi:glutamine cyclotransferase
MKLHHRPILLALLLFSGLILTSCSHQTAATPTIQPSPTLAPPTPSRPLASATAVATPTDLVESPLPASPVEAITDSPLPADAEIETAPEPLAESPIYANPLHPRAPFSQSPVAASPIEPPAPGLPVRYSYAVINVYDHDPAAYTQGLVYVDGWLYESTGLRGGSSLRKVDLATGTVEQMLRLPDLYFGEGMTILDDRIYQLTWQSNVGFVYDRNDFSLLEEFHYPWEGWGLTHDGERLIMSDGTSTLHFLDPQTLEEVDQLEVTTNGVPVFLLNELEYISGRIFANVWKTDEIAIIDPQSGAVTGWIDLTGLLDPAERQNSAAVLNGIAYDVENNRLFLTGKFWPKLFEVAVVDSE